MADLNVYQTDNLSWMKEQPNEKYDLIYVDPPFNTGVKQIRKTGKDDTEHFGYNDSFDDFKGFIYPRMEEAYRLLKKNGSFFFHLDFREIHYCKVWLDEIFGRPSFINEIIWAYDWGSRSKKKWSCKHDTILWYAKDPNNYTFNFESVDRIPYITKSEGLVSKEKQKLGKTLTDAWDDTNTENLYSETEEKLLGTYWWNTIVGTASKEKTGYATQKPLRILNRIVKVHSNEGDNCLDFFAGSGSFGEACISNGRNCDLTDINPPAIEVMKNRFLKYNMFDSVNFYV